MAGLLYFKFGTQKSGIDHHFAPCIVPAWDWAHRHLAPEAAIMATMAVIMVGVTTRAIASDSFRWGSLTFSVRLPAFLSYLSRCDHRCRKYLSIERQRQTSWLIICRFFLSIQLCQGPGTWHIRCCPVVAFKHHIRRYGAWCQECSFMLIQQFLVSMIFYVHIHISWCKDRHYLHTVQIPE